MKSPCINICAIDDSTGWCRGCGRSLDEIASWMSVSEAQRAAIWRELPDRLTKLAKRSASA